MVFLLQLKKNDIFFKQSINSYIHSIDFKTNAISIWNFVNLILSMELYLLYEN